MYAFMKYEVKQNIWYVPAILVWYLYEYQTSLDWNGGAGYPKINAVDFLN